MNTSVYNIEKSNNINIVSSNIEKNQRIKSLDIAKAIGIILIVLGHISENPSITKLVYSFHVPLFFIISGYLYRQNQKITVYLKKKVKTILIPYFIFGLLSYIYWFFLERYFRTQDINPLIPFCNLFIARSGEYNFIENAPLWFLPCLFCTEIIFDLLRRFFKKDYILFISILIISICGCIYNEMNFVSLPLELNTALIAIGFYYCGYIWNRKIEKKFKSKVNKKWLTVILIVISLISVLIISEINKGIYMYDEIYNNYILAYIGRSIRYFFSLFNI